MRGYTCHSHILVALIVFHHIEMDLKLRTLRLKLKSKSDQANNAAKYSWPALKLALTVFEKTLSGIPIPGLKGALGGFLELAKAEEVSARMTIFVTAARVLIAVQALIQNGADVLELQKQITKLTCILRRWKGVRELHPELKRRMDPFFS